MTRSTYLAALGILAATPIFSAIQPSNLCGTANAGLSVWEGPKNFQTPTSAKFTLYVNNTTANSIPGPLVAYVVPVNKAKMTMRNRDGLTRCSPEAAPRISYKVLDLAGQRSLAPNTTSMTEIHLGRTPPSGFAYQIVVTHGKLPKNLAPPNDFDGDGKSDFAVFNKQAQRMDIYLSSNDWNNPTQFTGDGQIFADAATQADFDGDGKVDPAFFSLNQSQWRVFFSSGKPAETVVMGGSNETHLIPGNFGYDDRAEIVQYRRSPYGQSIYNWLSGSNLFYPGGNQFSMPVPGVYFKDYPDLFTTAHLDKDGTFHRWGQPGVPFLPPSPSNQRRIAIAADYDNDGLDDVLGMIEETKQYRVLYSNGGMVTKGMPFPSAHKPLPGDFDGDGTADIAFVTVDGKIQIFFSDFNYWTERGGWAPGFTPNATYNLVY